MEPCGDKTADMGDVGQDQRPDPVGDRPESCIIDRPRVGAGADHDDLRLVLHREGLHLVEVDGLGLAIHPVKNPAIEPSGETGGTPVGEMAPVGEVHPQDRIPGLQDGKINGHVGLNARMRLHVDMLRPEELLAPLDGQPLDDIDEFAPPVVSCARVPLGVLVGHDAPLGLQDSLADEVFRGDHFEFSCLSPGLLPDGLRDLRVGLHQIGHGWMYSLPV